MHYMNVKVSMILLTVVVLTCGMQLGGSLYRELLKAFVGFSVQVVLRCCCAMRVASLHPLK
jgi:hypothetical protein